MQKIIFILLLLFRFSFTLSQIDTTRKDFFPLHINDLWQYRDENNKLAIQRVVGDTIINGERYFLLIHSLKSSGGGITRIDSLLRIVNDGYGSDSPIYRLAEKDSSVWPIVETFWGLPTHQPLARFNGITTAGIFGAQREIMHFDFGGIITDPPNDTLWGFGALLANGIGIIQEQYYEGEYYILQGAIIDSVQYGTIVSVEEFIETVPVQFVLFQNYPNLFNPTTAISYQVSVVSNVSLKVYDVLGREVMILVDGMKEAGYYTVSFDGSKLSSGIYFVRFIAQSNEGKSFIQTRKLLLMK